MQSFKIVALGDSTTAGTPYFQSPIEAPPGGKGNPESQYIYWIQKRYPEWMILNRGVNGERTDQIEARFERDVLNEKPDMVIILAGVNDLYQGYPTEHIKNHLSAMYQKAKEARIRILACSILPYDRATPEVRSRMKEMNEWIKSVSKEEGYGFADTYHAVENPKRPGYLKGTSDGLHPDTNTYQEMGKLVTDVIREQLNLSG